MRFIEHVAINTITYTLVHQFLIRPTLFVNHFITSFIVCPCNMINIFIITNTMHTIGVDKITLFKTT